MKIIIEIIYLIEIDLTEIIDLIVVELEIINYWARVGIDVSVSSSVAADPLASASVWNLMTFMNVVSAFSSAIYASQCTG